MKMRGESVFDYDRLTVDRVMMRERLARMQGRRFQKARGIAAIVAAPDICGIGKMQYLLITQTIEVAQQEFVILGALKPVTQSTTFNDPFLKAERQMVDVVYARKKNWIISRFEKIAGWLQGSVGDDFIRVDKFGERLSLKRLSDERRSMRRERVVVVGKTDPSPISCGNSSIRRRRDPPVLDVAQDNNIGFGLMGV